jgi:RimJ/RimL family protein N-acetyltransferase
MADTVQQTCYQLMPFDRGQAMRVASWIRDDAEMFWLAPGTPPPITPDKVVNWTRRRGGAFLFGPREADPVGYAELNSMQRDPRDLWIGHVLIDPQHRGQGLGRALTAALVHRAFHIERARRLTLVVFPENTAAVRCYQSAGFHLRREEVQVFGPQRRRYGLLRFEMTAKA